MKVRFHVQKLDGYTDGKPSWVKMIAKRSKDDALKALRDFQEHFPLGVYRVRKITRKR